LQEKLTNFASGTVDAICPSGWVVPDINSTVKFLEKSLGVSFPEPHRYSAEDLNIKYYGKVVLQ